jgi:hypothetical protein
MHTEVVVPSEAFNEINEEYSIRLVSPFVSFLTSARVTLLQVGLQAKRSNV